MENLRLVVFTLLIIGVIGFVDTAYINQSLDEYKIASIYYGRTKFLGFKVEQSHDYIKVKDVVKGTPAHRAGILNKDILVSLNYANISNIQNLKNRLNNLGENDSVTLGIIRKGYPNIIYIVFKPYIKNCGVL